VRHRGMSGPCSNDTSELQAAPARAGQARSTSARHERKVGPGRDTGAVIFSIDVLWNCGEPVQSKIESAFAEAFRPQDESACVWIDDRRADVLRMSWEVEADEYEQAINMGLDEIRTAASAAALAGRPVEVVAMTEAGHARWTE
jgi:hypothetical protein